MATDLGNGSGMVTNNMNIVIIKANFRRVDPKINYHTNVPWAIAV